MGNQLSSTRENNGELKPKSVSQILDYISTYYILTMDFKSLRKLYDKDYCDKLVILTSDIIERYFTDLEITYLSQRMKDGVEINEKAKEKIRFLNKDTLDNLDIQNSIKKKRICIEIAKFYIKIAHVFAAIVTTINPIYVYKDAEGNTVRATLNEKGNIPKNTPRDIYKLNICNNRINSLENKQSLLPDDNGEINIGPNFCNFTIDDDGQEKNLSDEPGIMELEQLYYDDNYDFKTGKFTGMSEDTRKNYLQNLQKFYEVFTGNKNMPETIKKFSDIKLKNYHKTKEYCKGSNPPLGRKYKGSLTDKLFSDYAENLKNMIRITNQKQESLLIIINRIFSYVIDPQTNKKQIRINPSLTEEELQSIVVDTRALIVNLYLTCEIYYENGLKIYEAIVIQKIKDTAENQITNLEKINEEIYLDNDIPEPAELQYIRENINKQVIKDNENLKKQIEHVKNEEKIENQKIELLLNGK